MQNTGDLLGQRESTCKGKLVSLVWYLRYLSGEETWVIVPAAMNLYAFYIKISCASVSYVSTQEFDAIAVSFGFLGTEKPLDWGFPTVFKREFKFSGNWCINGR